MLSLMTKALLIGVLSIFAATVARAENCALAASVDGSNNLSIALKTQAGADPSSGTPCAAASVDVTAATSFTVNSGSSFGTSNATPFKLRAFAVNNSGAIALAVAVLSAPGSFFAVNEGLPQSTTACNACNNATAAGKLYSTSALSSKPVREIGTLSWDNGLSSAGVWASGPTSIHMAEVGYIKAGQPVGNAATANIANTQASTTSATYVASIVKVDIKPTSKSNYITCRATGLALIVSASDAVSFIIQRGGVNVGLGYMGYSVNALAYAHPDLSGTDLPGSDALLTYGVFYKISTAGHAVVFPSVPVSSSEIGTSMTCEEIAG